MLDDRITRKPSEYSNYIARLQYYYRNKMNPYLNVNVVAGVDGGERFIGTSDMFGNAFHNSFAVTGISYYFALPIIEKLWNPECTKEQTRTTLIEAFKVLFVKDARACDQIRIATIDRNTGLSFEDVRLQVPWNYQGAVNKPNIYHAL